MCLQALRILDFNRWQICLQALWFDAPFRPQAGFPCSPYSRLSESARRTFKSGGPCELRRLPSEAVMIVRHCSAWGADREPRRHTLTRGTQNHPSSSSWPLGEVRDFAGRDPRAPGALGVARAPRALAASRRGLRVRPGRRRLARPVREPRCIAPAADSAPPPFPPLPRPPLSLR